MTAYSFRSSRPCQSITGKRQSGLSWSQINGRVSRPRSYRIVSIAMAVVMVVVVGVFG